MQLEETPKPPKKIDYVPPSDGLPRFYCNNVQMATTSFDMRMIFGEVVDIQPEKVVVEQNVQVTMSWAEAKIIAEFMIANIKAHEELNGPIQLPKNSDKIVVPDTFAIGK